MAELDENIINVTKAQQATTQFLDDSATATESPDNDVRISKPYFEVSASEEASSIAKFLRKPIEIATGEFASTDVAGTFPGPYQMPYTMINNNVYWPKLKGYYGFRATMVFTLQVNSQRFQQGRYMLLYVPCGGARNDTKVINWFNNHTATLVQRSQCPHVEIDINKETSVELRIPFNSSYDVYPLQYGTSASSTKWGDLRIFPYIALQAGSGSLTAKYTLWAHFEDIELVGQALPIERQSSSMKEAKSKGVGPVESVALKIKKAAGIVGSVPVLSSYMMPLSWAADIAARTANVFGWSSPANVDKQYRVETSLMSYATNVDKVDKTFPLSYSLKNEVQVLKGEALDDADEMSIPHLAGRYCYQAYFFWTDAAAEESLISSYLVGLYPTGGPLTHVDSGSTFTDFTPAQWIAKRFEMYRGSVKMRFKIVKTDFHSGRISIDFNPEARQYTSPAMLDADSPYLYRQIIDIRDINEFEIEFPFISHNPYVGTYYNGETHFGRIDIRVIDPLVAPATVANNIAFILEAAMGEDIEFAGRMNKECFIQDVVEIQSNSMMIGDTVKKSAQLETSKTCIGEKILSMRSILKRYEPLAYSTDGLGTYSPTGVTAYRPHNFGFLHSISPFGISIASDVPFTTSPAIKADLYSELGMIFCYSRGGVRLKVNVTRSKANGNNNDPSYFDELGQNTFAILGQANYSTTRLLTCESPAIGVWGAGVAKPSFYNSPTSLTTTGNYMVIQNDKDRTIEIQVPQWLRQHSRNNVMHTCSFLSSYVADNDDQASKAFVSIYQQSIATSLPQYLPLFGIDVWRAGADDCNFTGFISIPPMVIFPTPALNSPL